MKREPKIGLEVWIMKSNFTMAINFKVRVSNGMIGQMFFLLSSSYKRWNVTFRDSRFLGVTTKIRKRKETNSRN